MLTSRVEQCVYGNSKWAKKKIISSNCCEWKQRKVANLTFLKGTTNRTTTTTTTITTVVVVRQHQITNGWLYTQRQRHTHTESEDEKNKQNWKKNKNKKSHTLINRASVYKSGRTVWRIMSVTRNMELRHLSISDTARLSQILDNNDSWKSLMEKIPKNLDDIQNVANDAQRITRKYSADNIKWVLQ